MRDDLKGELGELFGFYAEGEINAMAPRIDVKFADVNRNSLVVYITSGTQDDEIHLTRELAIELAKAIIVKLEEK